MEPRPERILDYREYPVLYVDDEPENLRIFQLGFRRDFSILTAASGEEGLRILNEHPIALVLSDHRMPRMTGTEFLARVREMDPKTIRILVTAYGDAETLGSAINDGSIYRYVPKPWRADELRMTIQRGIEVYALDREREALIRELTTVNRLGRVINQELALEPLFDLLLRALTDDLGFDGAALLLLEERGERARFVRQRPLDDPVARALSKLSLRASEAPRFFGDLSRGEVTVLRFDEATRYEAPVRQWATEVSAEEIMVLPLRGKSGVIGALAVDNRRGRCGFDVDDRTLLDGVTMQAVIALENARLVDDLRRSRQQVIRAERLGTLGTLAAGLAHEINNPLVAIHTFLSLAAEKRKDDDAEFWGDYHRLACQEVERIRGLVATMARLGRAGGEAPRFVPCDAATLLDEVATLVAREASSAKVTLAVEVEPDLPKVLGVREQLHQVLLNLVLNAFQASAPGSEVRLAATTGGPGGVEGVCIEVSDRGHGIDEEHLERIFDPFFTTMGPDGGTGLGLMICHRVVADHGGIIEVTSRPGEGACFRVRLPLEPPPEAGEAAAE
jgi:two-component system, NtrC family, sensor kinase